jgi:phospholipid/cholesterol/gamma-HCH transport system substrate-binding protein
MERVHSAAHNIDLTTQQLQGTIAKALAPDAYGRDAGDNIRETLSSVNDATANIVDDTEALKHGFLFRGFFKRRGYYSLARLTPEQYRNDKAFANPKHQRVWIQAGELFESKGQTESLSKAGKARLDAAIGEMGERAIGAAMVVEGYAISEGAGGELGLSRSRATLVRNYVQARFQIDGQNIGTVPLRGVPPTATHKSSWSGVCIVLLAKA